jgi:hypothetical protein
MPGQRGRDLGNPVRIPVDTKGETWSKRQSDWETKPGLQDYLDNLLKKAEEQKKEDQGKASKTEGK